MAGVPAHALPGLPRWYFLSMYGPRAAWLDCDLHLHIAACLRLLADDTAAILQSAFIRSFSYPPELRFDRPLSPEHLLVALEEVAGSSPVGHPPHKPVEQGKEIPNCGSGRGAGALLLQSVM
jgi:hypothetical protein